MTTRKRNALVLGAILLVAGGLFFAFGRTPAAREGTTADAIPSGAFLVATVNVAGLDDSPLAAPLAPFVASLGADEVEKRCGFQPISRVRELAVAIPEGQDGDFGIVARGTFTRDELEKCTKAVISGRGGSPVESQSGDFSLVTDDASTLTSPSKVAWNDRGLVIVGRGGWLTQMMEAASGARPRIDANEEHAELTRTLGKGRLLVATATLPAPLRKKIEREFQGDAEGENDMMRGVLGVSAAGIALGTSGAVTEIALELRCDSDDACAQVEKLLAKKKSEWSADLGYRVVGIGALMDDLTVKVEGSKLHATAHVPTDDARRIIEILLERRSGRGRTPPTLDGGVSSTPGPASSTALAGMTGEVLGAKPQIDAGTRKLQPKVTTDAASP